MTDIWPLSIIAWKGVFLYLKMKDDTIVIVFTTFVIVS